MQPAWESWRGAVFAQLLPGSSAALFPSPEASECAGEGLLEVGGGENWAGEVVVFQVPAAMDNPCFETKNIFKNC